jgi:hypothetical protein
MMRNIRHAILFLFGCSFILFALFAFNLGLDSNPGWGRSRTFAFLLGVLSIAAFADSRFGSAWIENAMGHLVAGLIDIREKIFNRLHISKSMGYGVDQHIRNRLIYGSVVFVFLTVISIYGWFASAGTWITLPESSSYYNQLANAFVHGQVSLEIKVNPQLLALSDPYDYPSRNGIKYLWDASLYHGKYYLYWGPIPAIIVAGIKLVLPLDIGDQIIVFVAAAGLFFFQTLLITTIWMRSFQRLPVWTLLVGILLAGLVTPITWMIHSPEIY